MKATKGAIHPTRRAMKATKVWALDFLVNECHDLFDSSHRESNAGAKSPGRPRCAQTGPFAQPFLISGSNERPKLAPLIRRFAAPSPRKRGEGHSTGATASYGPAGAGAGAPFCFSF